MRGPSALALAAGMAAAVNPCGFALLPAYLSAFVGLDERRSRAGAVGRALAVSAVLTAGFVLVFASFGLLVTPFAFGVQRYLPWLTIVIGVTLLGLGGALLAGRNLVVRLPKLSSGGRDGTLPSMFLFGVSYATASLSCTIGPFLAVTTSTFRTNNWFAGLGVFAVYALGMGIVVTSLTLAVALARAGLVRRFRSLLPKMNRIAGGFLVIAGAYVAYYGWYEIRVLNGTTEDPVIDRASVLQGWLQQTIVPDDPFGFTMAAVAATAVAATVVTVRRRHRTGGPAASAAERHPR